MLKREWGAESNGKLLHLFICSKTATLVPEFEAEDLPLDNCSLGSCVFSERRALGQNAHDDDDKYFVPKIYTLKILF